MKRIFAMLLAVIMVAALLPANALVSAETVTTKPFYCLNGKDLWEEDPYVYTKPSFYTKTVKVGEPVKVSCYGTSDIKTLAQKLKEDFDNRPEGTRYFNFGLLTRAIHHVVEYSVYFDKAVDVTREWLEEFLAEYKRIGGKLDGIALDLEYIYCGGWYITKSSKESYTDADEVRYNNANIFQDIVNDPRYKTELRPMLEKYGFDFYPASKQDAKKSEIYSIATKDSRAYNIWGYVMSLRMRQACDDAVYAPLIKYYPDALISDYQVMYTNGWQKALKDSATPILGNRTGVGGLSCFNAYAARPDVSIYGMDSKTKKPLANPSYTYPASFNEAAYELTSFNTCLWELNIFKNMYAATEAKKIAAHITYFNYHPTRLGTYSNTPYYTENVFHIAMLDPQPLMSYIIPDEVVKNGQNFDDPNIGDYEYNINVVSSIMKELTRVAGASDRKPIEVPATWNSKFILSGMYAGGRNIWRITPDTSTGVTLEQFKVKDKAPTFYINGQTITFPQGRIIKDGNILQVGSCGYWVETPANVMPIVTNDADRYSEYPSLLEDFEGYAADSVFDSTSALPAATWEVGGNAKVQSIGTGKALALTGSVTLQNVKLPANITAGDAYAKQQAWEMTVTLPNSGEMKLLTHSTSDLGIKLADGKMYYDQGGKYQELAGVSLSAGSTYTVKKEIDFRTANAFKVSYSVYDANGNKLGGADNVAVATVSLPISKIGIFCQNISGTAYIDNYKLYPTGVTTVLEAYDATTGYILDGTTSNKDAAYRMSWMNASSQPKVAKIYNNGTLLETIQMAPGQDGVSTGVVKGSNISFTVTTENGTAASVPNYDNGDFAWTAVAESIGLAKGAIVNTGNTNNSGGNTNNGGTNATTPNGGADATTPNGGVDATNPNGGNDSTIPGGSQSGTNKPDSNKPGNNKPAEGKGEDGVIIALIVILVVLLLGGGFALLWFVVKPKWLMALKPKIQNLFKKSEN